MDTSPTLARPSDASAFEPARWLRNAHLQTLYAALAVPKPKPALVRTRWATPDGDFIDLDWLASNRSMRPDSPLVVLFHGLEGGSRSHYARSLMAAVQQQCWSGVVVHFRGCSGEPNRLARAYHSGDAAEIDWILRRFASTVAARAIFPVGVSLGGNALLKWLGEHAANAQRVVRAACGVSVPQDLAAAGDALDRGFNRAVYTRNFLRSLIRKSLAKHRQFPHRFDVARARRASTLRAFDDAVTAPLHGFIDAQDYWTRASCKPWLGRICVPTLVINALDDPFLPSHALARKAQVSAHVCLEYPQHGGHAGFVSGRFPGSIDWLPSRILRYFRQSLQEGMA